MTIDLRFDLPMGEALEFWRGKARMSPKEFYALAESYRVRAFTVSGLARADMLDSIHRAIEQALNDGASFDQWQKAYAPLWEANGWTGIRAWRVDNIYRTNLQTAYNVGRYKQMMEVTEDRPYWQYSAVDDSRTRPTHRALHGRVYRYDSPFWDTFYPPNGFRCFPSGTRVLTPSGWVMIEGVRPGDRVVGGSGQAQLVDSVHKNSFVGQLVRLSIEGGRIAATPNHRILTTRGWVRAELIQRGDVLVQTRKLAMQDNPVGDVNQSEPSRADCGMTVPSVGPACPEALNAEVQPGQEYVNPARPSCRYDHVPKRDYASACDKVGCQESLGHCRLGTGVGVSTGVGCESPGSAPAHFTPDLRASRGSGCAQFLCRAGGAGINVLGLPTARVEPGCEQPVVERAHLAGGLLPAGVVALPLRGDSFTTPPGVEPTVRHEAHQGTGVDRQPRANSSVREPLILVETAEDFAEGAPLSLFDSADDFLAWARAHADLYVVLDVERVQYIGNVYNLSVRFDHSYVIDGATVHNCRCKVKTLSARQVEARGLEVWDGNGLGELIEPPGPGGTTLPARPLMPDKGFAGNPGKEAWHPDISKYPDWLRNKLGGVQTTLHGIAYRHSRTIDEARALAAELGTFAEYDSVNIGNYVNIGLVEAKAVGVKGPSSVRVDPTPFAENPDWLMAYRPGEDVLLLNPHLGLREMIRKTAEAGSNKYFSTSAPLHVIRHEIGHAMLYHAAPLRIGQLSMADRLNPRVRPLVEKEVSEYAATNPLEFVAEVYAGLRDGRTYSDKIMRMYHAYGGV